jgi:hypothetical protein
MRFITSFLFLLNAGAWVIFSIICWNLTGAILGWISIAGFIAFLIAWGLSGEAQLSIRDYFRLTEWELFVTKLKWSNGVCTFIMGFLTILFVIFDWGGMRDFLEISL